MHRKSSWLVLCMTAVVAGFGQTLPTYQVVDLNPIGGGTGYLGSLNSSNVIVEGASIWQQGRTAALSIQATGISQPIAISDAGAVGFFGEVNLLNQEGEYFQYWDGVTLTTGAGIPIPAWKTFAYGAITALNSNGLAIGPPPYTGGHFSILNVNNGTVTEVLSPADLAYPNCPQPTSTLANAISNSGVIAGDAQTTCQAIDGTNIYPGLYNIGNGTWTILPALAYCNCLGNGNNYGEAEGLSHDTTWVAGFVFSSGSPTGFVQDAALWHNGVLTDLSANYLPVASTNAMANGVNNSGYTVGAYCPTGNSCSPVQDRAFLYVPGTGAVDLNTLINPNPPGVLYPGPITLTAAVAINDNGWIVANGIYGQPGPGVVNPGSVFALIPTAPACTASIILQIFPNSPVQGSGVSFYVQTQQSPTNSACLVQPYGTFQILDNGNPIQGSNWSNATVFQIPPGEPLYPLVPTDQNYLQPSNQIGVFNSSGLAAGQHTITVNYSGSGLYRPATLQTSLTVANPPPPISPCDLFGTGTIDVTDVQQIINEALGLAYPGDDLNGDGALNVLDVQIEINAALMLGCAAS